ncbi:VOC family protein [Gallibacterium melopsittaci]|uniref:2-oxoadipate dioxygenase/decarboxylase n=1 Tax=Gallibacterium melopsittaci TaxID=516063 RepID=A0ABV6HTT8_9PAST
MSNFIAAADIRCLFSSAMSKMYQQEVPLYSELIQLVNDVNAHVLATDQEVKDQLTATGELARLDIERHGAIRLGLPEELATMRRLFSVMGMYPVGYYDLAPAGVPVHSTAFRAIDADSLNVSPFRVFTSLLRLELIDNPALREKAEAALHQRNIFTPRVIELIEQFEKEGGLTQKDAEEFVSEALETFRWHDHSPVSKELYEDLHRQHRLIADVVAFQGPHINHLTPRTLDIDEVQIGMSKRGITPKAVVEGPPRRKCPIFLRQTSFKALEEAVKFKGANGEEAGTHTARFGEIEQRGVALTQKGRELYDRMLNIAREKTGGAPTEANAEQYMQNLAESFIDFPDDYRSLYDQGLAYFYYQPNLEIAAQKLPQVGEDASLDRLLDEGIVKLEPIVYEDFLPVSAAGIFQSNLGEGGQGHYDSQSNQAIFEASLGTKVLEINQIYQNIQNESLEHCLAELQKLRN